MGLSYNLKIKIFQNGCLYYCSTHVCNCGWHTQRIFYTILIYFLDNKCVFICVLKILTFNWIKNNFLVWWWVCCSCFLCVHAYLSSKYKKYIHEKTHTTSLSNWNKKWRRSIETNTELFTQQNINDSYALLLNVTRSSTIFRVLVKRTLILDVIHLRADEMKR